MFHNKPTAQIEIASIGWEDEDDYVFFGEDGNDGHTFIRAQLFRGRDVTKPLNPDRAQGTKILCSLNSMGGFRIPPKDTRCYVACPTGMEEVPGAPIIMGTVEKHSQHYDLSKNGDQVMSAGQGQARIIAKNDGSVTMFTTFDNTKDGQSVYFRVAPDGFKFVAPFGTLYFDVTGLHVNHVSGAGIDLGGIYGLPAPFDSAPLNQLLSFIRMTAGTLTAESCVSQFSAGATNKTKLVGADALKLALAAIEQQITDIADMFKLLFTGGTALIPLLAANLANPGGPALVGPVASAAVAANTVYQTNVATQEALVLNASIETSVSADPEIPA